MIMKTIEKKLTFILNTAIPVILLIIYMVTYSGQFIEGIKEALKCYF